MFDYINDRGITYKVWWKISVTHSEDGYFKKTLVDIHEGYKYTPDHWQAKEILDKVNKSIETLGLAHLAQTGISEE